MTFEEMQQGELAWWTAFLKRPNARERLLAVYGYRYLPFFFEEFNNMGHVVDFGSGPVSAALAAEAYTSLVCVDPLMDDYIRAGMIRDKENVRPVHLLTDADKLPAAEFDTALVFNVLDHAARPVSILAAAAKAIKPGGKVLLWVHVDQEADALHVRVSKQSVVNWIGDVGLSIDRQATLHAWGTTSFMAVAR